MFRFSLTPSSQQLLFLLCSRVLSVAVTTPVTRRCHLAAVFQTQRPVTADGKLLKMFKNRGFRSRILRPTPEDSQNSRSGAPSCKRPGLPAPPLSFRSLVPGFLLASFGCQSAEDSGNICQSFGKESKLGRIDGALRAGAHSCGAIIAVSHRDKRQPESGSSLGEDDQSLDGNEDEGTRQRRNAADLDNSREETL